MTRTLRLLFIAAGMTGFLVFMLTSHLAARAGGTEILLPVEGYDPRDIFLGHFAELRTPLNALRDDQVEVEDGLAAGDTVYVRLAQGPDGSVEAVSIQATRPDDGLFAQGRLLGIHPAHGEWIEETDPETGLTLPRHRSTDARRYEMAFNTERYYAPRQRALALEQRLRNRDVLGEAETRLILSVTRDGRLLIKGVEQDGERFEDRIW